MAQPASAQGGGTPTTLHELNRSASAQHTPLRYTDPTGHWIERAVDIAFIADDIWDITQNGLTWDNGLALAADVGGLLLPGLTGLGMAVRGGRAAVEAASHSDEVVDAARAVAKAADHADDAADAARAAAQGGEAADAARSGQKAAEAAVHGAGQPHKNANHAVSHFGIYEIKVNGETYKFGKADLDRVTQSSGWPTRLHQQVRQLRKTFQDVSAEIIDDLGYVTTQQAKQAERAALQRYYETTRRIPPGNQKSFRPD